MKYYKPPDIKEAVRLKETNKNSFFLAGGTEINSIASEGLKINCLINISKAVSSDISCRHIGAAATIQNLIDHPDTTAPLKEAASHINNRNIRNIATVGGNIATNKSGSDLIGTLIVLKARLEIMTVNGKKYFPLNQWINSPCGLILSIKLPEEDRAVFHRRFSRTKNDLPLLKITAGFKADENGVFKDIIITAGSAAEKVTLMEKTSKFFNGKSSQDIDSKELNPLIKKDINPVSDHRASASYRIKLAEAALFELLDYHR